MITALIARWHAHTRQRRLTVDPFHGPVSDGPVNGSVPGGTRVPGSYPDVYPYCVPERFESVLVLPDDLLVDVGALGHRFGSIIGGVPVELAVPIFDEYSTGPARRLTAPVRLPPQLRDKHAPDWGYEGAPRTKTATVEQLVLSLEHPGDEEALAAQLKHVANNARAWFRNARAWICAWTGDTMAPTRATHDATLSWIQPDGVPTAYGGRIEIKMMGDVTGATTAQLGDAFERAGTGDTLPLAWQLLQVARDNLFMSEHRRAAIDACSAAEVAIADALRGLSPPLLNEEQLNRALRLASGVVEAADLYTFVAGPTLPVHWRKLSDQLAKRRNDAVHAGAPLSHEQAVNAVAVARQLVEALTPVHNPGAEPRADPLG